MSSVKGPGERSIGWENEGRVESRNNARVKEQFAAARSAGKVQLTPLKDFEIVALKAELNSGTRSRGDRTVDLGNGEQLINRDDTVYLRSGESFSRVSGFSFPPLPMASPRF